MSKQLCVHCKKNIRQYMGDSFFSTKLACDNDKCPRYGLVTVVYLEADSAVSDLVSNNPEADVGSSNPPHNLNSKKGT